MGNVNYKETGEIDDKTPLEPFFEAMLPLLGNYRFKEKFPADKPSVWSGGLSGYQYDILIGELPTAFRYVNYTPGGYSAFPDEERTLESVGFAHVETNEKFYIRISISGYPDRRLQITLEFSGAKSEVAAFMSSISPVLANYNFELKKTDQSGEISKSAPPKTVRQKSLKLSSLFTNDGFAPPEIKPCDVGAVKTLDKVLPEISASDVDKNESQPQFETVLLNVIHGFWSENGFVDAVVTNYFCLVPQIWTEDGKIKEEFAEKFLRKIFGQHWKTGSSSDPDRMVGSYSSSVLNRRLADETRWVEMETDDRTRCQFYVASESGKIKAVYAKDFRK